MKKKCLASLMAVLAVGTAIALSGSHWFSQPDPSPIPIVIARLKTPHSGLLHIAEAKGYLAEEGLAATIVTKLTGLETLEELLAGRVDVAGSAETPVARVLAQGRKVRFITTIYDSFSSLGIVARKDRAIADPADLKGKRIGYTFGTVSHYMLETFLAFHNIALDSVSLVPTKPDAIVGSLASGELDAAASWNPYLVEMRRQLGDNARFFSSAAFFSEAYNLVIRPDYLPANREAVDRLLRALYKAESFGLAHPEEAKRIIATASGLDPSAMSPSNEPLTHELTLKQSLLLATENEIRWYLRRGLVPEGPFPDVLDAFEVDPLRRLNASRVSIVK